MLVFCTCTVVRHHVIFFNYMYSLGKLFYLKCLVHLIQDTSLPRAEEPPLFVALLWLYLKHCTYSVYALTKNTHIWVFRSELDACDSPDKYPQLFQVLLEIEVENTEKQKDLTPPWEQFPTKDLSPNVLFTCHQEHKDALAATGNIQ